MRRWLRRLLPDSPSNVARAIRGEFHCAGAWKSRVRRGGGCAGRRCWERAYGRAVTWGVGQRRRTYPHRAAGGGGLRIGGTAHFSIKNRRTVLAAQAISERER